MRRKTISPGPALLCPGLQQFHSGQVASAHLEKVQGKWVSVGQQQVTPQNTQGFIWTHESVRLCAHVGLGLAGFL